MIKIISYRPINKNTMVGTVDVKISKWGDFVIREIAIFQKNSHRWICFPNRSYEKDGKRKYFHFNAFDDPKTQTAFQEKVLNSFDEYIKNLSSSSTKESSATDELNLFP